MIRKQQAPRNVTKISLLIFIVFAFMAAAVSAHDAQISLTTQDLPYTHSVILNLSDQINNTMNITYDSWLSGPQNITFVNQSQELPVSLSIPSGVPAGEYTRLIMLTDGIIQIEKIILISIVEHNPLEGFIFRISLSRETAGIGQPVSTTIFALNQSNVTIEICEDGQGFVPCYSPIALPNTNFPYTLAIPYTNKTGTYVITAKMNYNNEMRVAEASYTVSNSMAVSVEGETRIDINQATTLAAYPSAGIPPYTYRWTLPGNIVRTTPVINASFASPGQKIIGLKVTDSADNFIARNITINVLHQYAVQVAVMDEKNNASITDAQVSIHSTQKPTPSSGKVTFTITEGYHTITVMKTGYEIYNQRHNIDKPTNVTVYLSIKDEDKPQISLGSPDNNALLNEGAVDFRFTYSDISQTGCELYIGEFNNSFFMLRNHSVYSASGTYSLGSMLLDGKYRWKIECVDIKGNRGSSPVRNLTIQSNHQEAAVTQIVEYTAENRPNIIKILYDAQDRMALFDVNQQEAAEALRFNRRINDALRFIERLDRDMHDIHERKDLTQEEKNRRNDELVARLDTLYSTIPVDIQVHKTHKFISYATPEELLQFIEIYYAADQKNKQSLAEYLMGIQSKLSSSVTTMQATLYFPDEHNEEITLVTKKPQLQNLSKSEVIIEYIPSDFANPEQVEFITETRTLNNGLFEYTTPANEQDFTYYIKKRLPLEDTEKFHTLVINSRVDSSFVPATGHSILKIDTDINFRSVLIFLIVIAIATFVFHHFDGGAKIKQIVGKPSGLNFMRSLVSDALTNLEAGNYENAKMVFSEIRLSYENLPGQDQFLIYDNITEVACQLDLAYINDIIDRCHNFIDHQEAEFATQEYTKIKQVFDSMEPSEQERIFPRIVEIHNRIQHTLAEDRSDINTTGGALR